MFQPAQSVKGLNLVALHSQTSEKSWASQIYQAILIG